MVLLVCSMTFTRVIDIFFQMVIFIFCSAYGRSGDRHIKQILVRVTRPFISLIFYFVRWLLFQTGDSYSKALIVTPDIPTSTVLLAMPYFSSLGDHALITDLLISRRVNLCNNICPQLGQYFAAILLFFLFLYLKAIR